MGNDYEQFINLKDNNYWSYILQRCVKDWLTCMLCTFKMSKKTLAYTYVVFIGVNPCRIRLLPRDGHRE